jgi:hypothetical protein
MMRAQPAEKKMLAKNRALIGHTPLNRRFLQISHKIDLYPIFHQKYTV